MPAFEYASLEPHLPELVALRRDLHAHPETAFEEVRTAGIVASRLREWGLEVHEGVGGTGVVAVLNGDRPGQRCIALRADMDALHIQETSALAYASKAPGKMHACGHDGHTTMLLGAARLLALAPDFAGRVLFVFQPAEETVSGAPAMIGDGFFSRFPCDAIYGLHTQPGQAVGELSSRAGAALAGASSFHATFHGTGGHGGAGPHLATDATIPAAQFILALQSIVGRNVPATEAAVLSVGFVSGGAAASPNVMPRDVRVSGTIRYFRPETLTLLKQRIDEQAECLAQANRCTVDVTYEAGSPPLVNEAGAFATAMVAAERSFGRDKVDRARALSTGSEDFASFASHVPGAYVWIGGGAGPDGLVHEVHTSSFDFNDESLPCGISYWINLVDVELGN